MLYTLGVPCSEGRELRVSTQKGNGWGAASLRVSAFAEPQRGNPGAATLNRDLYGGSIGGLSNNVNCISANSSKSKLLRQEQHREQSLSSLSGVRHSEKGDVENEL